MWLFVRPGKRILRDESKVSVELETAEARKWYFDVLPGVELVQGATDRPHVERAVIGQTKDCRENDGVRKSRGENGHTLKPTDLGSTVESRNEVRRDLVLGDIGSRAEVTDLESRFRFVDLRQKHLSADEGEREIPRERKGSPKCCPA